MRVFEEKQRFTQLWLIVLMAVSLLVPLAIIYQEYVKEQSTFSATEFVLISLLLLFSGGIIFLFQLKTKIDENGIYYQFFPFNLKMNLISWQEISKAYVRKYDAMTEFGGWGLKGGSFWNKEKGKCINVSGDIGIQLELQSGKKLLIGTQKEIDAKNVLAFYKSKFEWLE